MAGPLDSTEVSGPGLSSVEAGAVSKFRLVPKDSFGNVAAVGEHGVKGTLSPIATTFGKDSEDIKLEFVQNDDNSFTGLYTATKAGTYKLEILVAGQEIKGSPFAVR